MAARILCVILFIGLIGANGALAQQLTYSDQTGSLSASGTHPALAGSSLNQPVLGLSDLDLILVASASAGSDSYLGSAALETSLGSTTLFLEGSSVGQVAGCNPFDENAGCFASGSANVTIAFELTQDAFSQIDWTQLSATNNGPFAELTHQTLGFVLAVSYFGDYSIPECGTLDMATCFALADVFDGGAVLPGGQYEIEFDLFAFTPVGSCNVGCNNAGGSYQLTIVPEPSTALLMGLGLFGLGARRRALG